MDAKKPTPQTKPAGPPTGLRKTVDFSPTALSRPASPATLKGLFESPEILERIKAVVPKHVTPERLMKVFLSAILKTPDLLNCTQASLVQAVINLSELGLDPAGGLGFAYLVPFRENKKDGTVVTLATAIIGYRGYIELARRSGQLSSVRARVVHAKDTFKVRYGLVEDCEHIPSDAADPGPMTHVYCVAEFKDGGHHMEIMSAAQVEVIRQGSPGKNSPAWRNHPEAMAQKTVIRRAAHFWPLSPELGRALETDETTDVDVDPFERGGGRGAPALSVVSFGSTTDAEYTSEAPASSSADAEPEGMNPETGEVPLEQTQAPEEPEPADPIGSLLWRIARATKENIGKLQEEAMTVPKEDSRRGEVGRVMMARRKELGV